MRERSSETPPCGALTWPSSDEPTPNGTMRRVVPRAELDEVDHVVPGFGEHHRVRRLVLEPGQRVPVRLADRLRGGEAIAETGGEIGIERGDRLARETALALADGEWGHGSSTPFLGRGKIRRARAAWLGAKRDRVLALHNFGAVSSQI